MPEASEEVNRYFARLDRYEIDFSDVRGQEFAKRALVVPGRQRPAVSRVILVGISEHRRKEGG